VNECTVSDTGALRIRSAVRAVVVAPEDGVLLVRFEFPGGTRWALPGGGLEPGETHHQALARELGEELGLSSAPIGPAIWRREQLMAFPDGSWDGQREVIFLVEVAERFEPRPALGWEHLRQEYVHEIRWWSDAELMAVPDTVFIPRRLPELLPSVRVMARDRVWPLEPVDTGP
jgi:8-oxo-dGTP diphosphatase